MLPERILYKEKQRLDCDAQERELGRVKSVKQQNVALLNWTRLWAVSQLWFPEACSAEFYNVKIDFRMVGWTEEEVSSYLSISVLQETGAILLQLLFVSAVYISPNLQEKMEMLLLTTIKRYTICFILSSFITSTFLSFNCTMMSCKMLVLPVCVTI